jgi:hypothetical protein
MERQPLELFVFGEPALPCGTLRSSSMLFSGELLVFALRRRATLTTRAACLAVLALPGDRWRSRVCIEPRPSRDLFSCLQKVYSLMVRAERFGSNYSIWPGYRPRKHEVAKQLQQTHPTPV